MAAKKSKDNPNQWPNGEWHSITWAQEQQRVKNAKADPNNLFPGYSPQQIAALNAIIPGGTGVQGPAATAAAAATPTAAPTASGPAAPAAPAKVDPFFTPDDLDAINQFTTDLNTKLTGIDTGLANAETDTTYQKTQNETSAKQNAATATDDAISRGIFSSSITDASLYDIEAQRSLAAKFLDDKLTTARLDAGTNKQILGTAKENFDTNMAARKTANAQGVNDTNNTAWAAATAAWAANQPVTTPTPAAPATTATAKPPVKGLGTPVPLGGNTLFAPTPTAPAKTPGKNPTKPRTVTTKVQYGNTP